ncbi:hypothetical protein D3C78_1743750 [compost metagenome]
MLLVNLQKLEGGARTVAFELGALDVRIVDVALDPAAGRRLELALLDLLAKLSAAAVAANRRFRHVLFPSWRRMPRIPSDAPGEPYLRMLSHNFLNRFPIEGTMR